jgi:copper homeostasis protein
MTSNISVEICIDSVDSALAAERGGAQRVELCSNLWEGGVTPSAGLIATVRKKISIGLQVMVRPRGGDFCHSDDEFEIMQQDVKTAKSLGADGIVVALLQTNARVDVARTRELVELAAPLPVTFHRAFDVVTDLPAALEDVISTGAKRILTSGGESSGVKGTASLTKLVQLAKGRISILAAGGINSTNAREIVEKSGVSEVHAGLRSIISGSMQQSNKKIAPGVTGMDESQRFVVLEEDVKKLKEALT